MMAQIPLCPDESLPQQNHLLFYDDDKLWLMSPSIWGHTQASASGS
jgi:hypothetical protein